MENRKILKDLSKNYILQEQIELIAGDDGINYWEYSDKEIIAECVYHLKRYHPDSGFDDGEAFNGDYGIEEQKQAKKECREIKRFLKKHQ